jgi:hypothetical protein
MGWAEAIYDGVIVDCSSTAFVHGLGAATPAETAVAATSKPSAARLFIIGFLLTSLLASKPGLREMVANGGASCVLCRWSGTTAWHEAHQRRASCSPWLAKPLGLCNTVYFVSAPTSFDCQISDAAVSEPGTRENERRCREGDETNKVNPLARQCNFSRIFPTTSVPRKSSPETNCGHGSSRRFAVKV